MFWPIHTLALPRKRVEVAEEGHRSFQTYQSAGSEVGPQKKHRYSAEKTAQRKEGLVARPIGEYRTSATYVYWEIHTLESIRRYIRTEYEHCQYRHKGQKARSPLLLHAERHPETR